MIFSADLGNGLSSDHTIHTPVSVDVLSNILVILYRLSGRNRRISDRQQ